MSLMSDQYVQRLDLGADPFSVDYAGNYFYPGAARKQLLDQIIHVSRFGEHVVLAVGSTGSGTSTLLTTAITRLKPVMACCYINAQAITAPEQLLDRLSEQLSLHLAPPVTTNELLVALKKVSSHSADDADAESILLIVDQAHFLDLESYSCLLEIFQRANGSIRLVFGGEYQIEQLAQLAGFSRQKIKVFELEPLTLSETDGLIMGLLCHVGYAGNQPLSVDQLAVLHEQSGGNIGMIRSLTPRMLVGDDVASVKKYALAIPVTHIVAIVVLVIALLASYLYEGSVDDKPVYFSENDLTSDSSVGVEGSVVDDEKSTQALKNTNLFDALVVDSTAVKDQRELTIKTIGDEVAEVEASKDKIIESETTKAEASKDKIIERETTKAEAAKDKAIESETTEDKVTTGIIMEEKAIASRVAKQENSPNTTKVKIEQNNTASAELKRSDLAEIKKQEKRTAQSTSLPTASKKKIMAIPRTAYMLQLLGTVEKSRAREFITLHKKHLAMVYIEVLHGGNPWFVVLAGPYKNIDVARAEKRRLPANLQRQKPWARSVLGIQQDIKKAERQ